MMEHPPRHQRLNVILGFFAVFAALLADFLTKWLAVYFLTPAGFVGHRLSLGEYLFPSDETTQGMMDPNFPAIEVVPNFFNFYLAHNTGGAFSILSGYPYLLALISAVVVVGIIWWGFGFNRNYALPFVGLGLLIGGAIGNLIDRVRFGYVIDFLDAYWGGSHWPTFNIADVCVDIGLGIILILAFFTKQLDPVAKKAIEPVAKD